MGTCKDWVEIVVSPEFHPVVVREVGLETEPLETLTVTGREVELKSSEGHNASIRVYKQNYSNVDPVQLVNQLQ